MSFIFNYHALQRELIGLSFPPFGGPYHIDQMLLKLESIGVKIMSVAKNQNKVIDKVKRNFKKISDLELNTEKKINEFINLIVNRIVGAWYAYDGMGI